MTGELLTQGEDWDNPTFGALFNRLEKEVKTPGQIIRYVRYYGEVGNRTEIRFFGIQVESIDNIPEGMVCLKLTRDTFTVYETRETGVVIIWQNELTGDWQDSTNPKYPIGEFITQVPEDWFLSSEKNEVRFIVSANSYAEKGKSADDDVKLMPYDPIWSEKYNEMAKQLQETIPADVCARIEHYGSTAIPGMPAKPIIDILMEIPSFHKARRYILPLFNKLECEYWWYNDHMVFIIRDKFIGTRIYHIHATPADHPLWDGIAFRDYLRTHPEDAARYAKLKHKLAEAHSNDRETYTDNKAEFVRVITEKAIKSKDGLT